MTLPTTELGNCSRADKERRRRSALDAALENVYFVPEPPQCPLAQPSGSVEPCSAFLMIRPLSPSAWTSMLPYDQSKESHAGERALQRAVQLPVFLRTAELALH